MKISSKENLVKVKKRCLETLETKSLKDAEAIGLLHTQISTKTIEKESLEDEVENQQVIESGNQQSFSDYVIESLTVTTY